MIDSNYAKWRKASPISTLPDGFGKQIVSKNRSEISAAVRKTFQELPLSNTQRNKLRNIIEDMMGKVLPDSISHYTTSGIVVAGFGESEVFPSLVSYEIDGIVENKLRYWEKKEKGTKIGAGSGTSGAAILPFAQVDMVATFMEGINPSYRESEESLLSEVFREYGKHAIAIAQTCGCTDQKDLKRLRTELARMRTRVKRKLSSTLSTFRRNTFVEPILTVVEGLPKDEMAAMAESLVNLTKSQRRVSPQAETVGGAVDVAVISKGDGYVWIKRKFYFEPEINPRFLARYYKDVQHEEQSN